MTTRKLIRPNLAEIKEADWVVEAILARPDVHPWLTPPVLPMARPALAVD